MGGDDVERVHIRRFVVELSPRMQRDPQVLEISANPDVESVCGAPGPVVDGARQSNCDTCRSKLLIASTKDKELLVRPAPDYTPEPWPNLESLEEIRKRRDGR